jgi:hypothetical protein
VKTLDDGQAGLLPGLQAACQVEDILAAAAAQQRAGAPGRAAAVAADDDRLARGKLANALVELGQRNVAGVRQVAGRVVGGRSHVEHDGAGVVDQPRGAQRVERGPGRLAHDQRVQQHRAGGERDRDQDNVLGNEIHVRSPCRKPRIIE